MIKVIGVRFRGGGKVYYFDPNGIELKREDQVIVELKSVEEMKKVYAKQLLTYLRLMDKRLGLLVNFNTDNILTSIHRVAN